MGRKSNSHRIQIIHVPVEIKVPDRINKEGLVIGHAFIYTKYKQKEIYHKL